MSQIAVSRSPTDRSELKTDSIVSGLSFMLLTNVMQRGVGFIRNLAFCYFLTEQHLGLWALASSFFILAAPFSVLGLPGSLGRFVEFFRVRHQLTPYLRRIAVGTAIGSIVVCGSLIVLTPLTSQMILGQPQGYWTMTLIAVTLLAVIGFNFLNELVAGLRQPRLASSMQMVNSMSFTALSLLWLAISSDWRGVMAAFAVASVLGMIPAAIGLRHRCLNAFLNQVPLGRRAMWQRIVPFAVSIWSMNLLTNLFDVVDRYMILHCASQHLEQGQAMVGQYHSGRILPALLTSLGMMISGMILPYLSADWEAGRIASIQRSLRTSFLLVALFFWGLSIAGMFVAPWLFQSLLQGRYSEGLAIMPIALVHCSFAALAMLLQNYFWCAERGRIIGLVMAIGLALNLFLNYHLVPSGGAWGAMVATCISGATILCLTAICLRQAGITLGKHNVIIAFLPITLILSTWLSALCFAIVAYLFLQTNLLISRSDREPILRSLEPLKKLGY